MSDLVRHFLMNYVAKIKKKFSMETVSSFTVRNLYVSSFTDILQSFSAEEAVRRTFTWGFEMGHEYMLELEKDVEKLKPRVDAPAIAKMAWYIFSGKDLSGIDSKWMNIDDAKFFMVKFWDDNCPWCRGVELAEKNLKMCSYPAGAFEGAYQTASMLMGLKNFVMVREIKCKAAGDEHCEFVIVDIPLEHLEKVVSKLEDIVPGFYSQLDYNFSKKLKEAVL